MKWLSLLFLVLTNLSFAGNLFIPTCDLEMNKELFVKMTNEELSSKSSLYLKRKDNCEAAGTLLEIYTRGVADESKGELLNSLFESLRDGLYLNQYTALLLGFQNELKSLNLEKISEDHARIYLKLLPNKGTNPTSQFTAGKKSLSLADEAEVNFSFFIKNFPENKLVPKINKTIAKLHEHKLKNAMGYIEFYQNRVHDKDVMTYQVKDFINTLVKTSSSESYEDGLYLLMKMIPQTSFSEIEKSKIEKIVFNILEDRKAFNTIKKLNSKLGKQPTSEKSVSSSKDLSEFVTSLDESELELNKERRLDDFLAQKGDDQILFLPFNDKFQLKASQVLLALGAVGVVMAFDQPIHDFVLKNKDVGIFDEIADFGNIFGELTGAAPLIAGTMAVGLVFDNNMAKEAAFSTLGALALTQLVVETMKYSVNRSRPEKEQGPFDFNGFGGPGAGRASFPSGHSAGAWTIATVFALEYGDEYKWAPAVAYSIAAMTSYARLNKDKHWASDVLLGAMIGYVSGNIMHRVFKKFWKSKADNIHIVPMIGKTTGIRVEITEKVYADLKHWPLDTFFNLQLNISNHLKKDPSEIRTIYKMIYL